MFASNTDGITPNCGPPSEIVPVTNPVWPVYSNAKLPGILSFEVVFEFGLIRGVEDHLGEFFQPV